MNNKLVLFGLCSALSLFEISAMNSEVSCANVKCTFEKIQEFETQVKANSDLIDAFNNVSNINELLDVFTKSNISNPIIIEYLKFVEIMLNARNLKDLKDLPIVDSALRENLNKTIEDQNEIDLLCNKVLRFMNKNCE